MRGLNLAVARWLCAGGVLAAPGVAEGSMPRPETVLYQTSFPGSDGDRPQDGPDWAVRDYASNTAEIREQRFEFRRVDSAGAGNAMFTGQYTDPEDTHRDASAWTDYRIDAVMRTSNATNQPGLVIRRTSPITTINHIQGYLGWIRSHSVDGVPHIDLRIVKNYSDSTHSGGDASGVLLKAATFEHAFQRHTDYRFSFEAVGNTFTLSLADMEETFLFSVTATDPDDPHLAGRPGLRHRPGNSGLWTAWDQVAFTAVGRPFEGPFLCDAMTFYMVHKGGPLRATLRAQSPGPTVPIGWGRSVHAAVLAHLYDPEQRRLETRYTRVRDGEPLDAELVFDAGPVPPGVYSLRYVTSGSRRVALDLQVDPPLRFGIQPRREPLAASTPGQWANPYFLVPPGARSLRPELSSGTGRVYDDKGLLRAEFSGGSSPEINPGDGSLAEPFSAPAGGIPAGWQANLNTAFGDVEIAPDPDGIPSLRLERVSGASGNALVLYTGSEGPFAAGRASDMDASVMSRTSSGNAYGLVARVQDPNALFSNFQGYHAFTQNNVLYLSRFDAEGWEGQSGYWRGHILAEQPLSDSPALRRIRFSVVGNRLEAAVYGPGEDEDFSELLASAVATDGAFSEGYFGFRSAYQANGRRAFFRDLDVLQPDRRSVWRIEMSMATHRTVTFGQSGDFDAIFCPDPRTARQIGGSLFAAGDGRSFPHRFQADMWDWLAGLRASDMDLGALPDMRPYEDAFAAEPRHQHLFGSWGVFSYLRHLLLNQTLAQPMSGRPTALTLAAAYGLDEPFNPFFRSDPILNRLLLSEFHRFLGLRQNDTERAGTLQLVANDLFEGDRTAFSLAAPHMPEGPLRALWLEGARRHVERYVFGRTSCENQSAHAPLNLEALHRGSGDPLYRTLAHDWMTDFLDPELNPHFATGYLMEGYGPDSTYQGLAANQLAWYYHWTGDERVRDALDRIYGLFNHTVAPEPDASMYGASNFCHRTPGSWAGRQYGGGTLSMSAHLPGAAAWHANLDPADAGYRVAIADTIRGELSKYWYGTPRAPPATPSAYRFVTYYRYFPDAVLPGARFPMVESDRFTRAFGNEFIAVRRPSYFALVYVGKPDPDENRIRERDMPDLIQRRTGGGLSLFWAPGFGNAVVSQNWHARTNQMPRADLSDGRVDWPDYYTVEHVLDEASGCLTVTSRMRILPVRLTRRIFFDDDRLRQEVDFFFEQAVSLDALFEQIPFPWLGKMYEDGVPNIESRVGGVWTPGVPGVAVEALRWTHGVTGVSVVVAFPDSASVRLGPLTTGATGNASSQVTGRSMGLIKIDLGTEFGAGQTLQLRYDLAPDPPPVTHVLSYTADAGGGMEGDGLQHIGDGASGSEVTARPEDGALFAGWSDGVLGAVRRETDVRGDLYVVASFRSEGGVPIRWYAEHGLAPSPGEGWDALDDRHLPARNLTLREAYVADLDPNDPMDAIPHLALGWMEDRMVFRLERTSDRRIYHVDMKTDLVDPEWLPFTSSPGTGGAWERLAFPPETDRCFFRLRITLP